MVIGIGRYNKWLGEVSINTKFSLIFVWTFDTQSSYSRRESGGDCGKLRVQAFPKSGSCFSVQFPATIGQKGPVLLGPPLCKRSRISGLSCDFSLL